MLATLADEPLVDKNFVYEPKYDGIRALVEIDSARNGPVVRLWSRNGNDKTTQFPTVAQALRSAAANAKLKGPVILDGELVALLPDGRPGGFQRLQGRIHLSDARDVERVDRDQPVALIAFDLLREGNEELCHLPLSERRKRLEQLFKRGFSPNATAASAAKTRSEGIIRISEQVVGDGRPLHERAKREQQEGIIAKEITSTYQPGRRSPAWRKIKVVQEQEFVVGGWTEPRQTRTHFGALLLGVYDGDDLVYVGHTGTGFNQKELERVSRLLKARKIPNSPFSARIKTNEPAHWVRPDLVAQIKFTEWTADHKLRHPVYLGLRDDKKASDVVRERVSVTPSSSASTRKSSQSHDRQGLDDVIEQLRKLEEARRDGELTLPNGDRVNVTNLAKVFWPGPASPTRPPERDARRWQPHNGEGGNITKGDLLRYYVDVSPMILPVVADRPLVMKRFPNGITGPAFYQQRSREEKPPPGVRIETLPDELDPIGEAGAKRFVGGSLTTLVYMTQIAAISQDPWFSRVQSPLYSDHAAIDLDPTEGATFAKVVDVARWVRDELESLRVPGFPKTSGSRGLHIYIPLPPRTTYESGMLFCQIVATVVASKHPQVATVERMVKRRPRGTIYIDFLQNILGKTLATAYSARASEFAGVSTPLSWQEIDETLDPRDFTIRTAPARFRNVGDLWEGLRTSKPANLETIFKKYAKQR